MGSIRWLLPCLVFLLPGAAPEDPDAWTWALRKGGKATWKIKTRVGHPRRGIDVRGAGGYIVVAPSTDYRWVKGFSLLSTEVADAPDWLLGLLTGQVASPAARAERKKSKADDRLTEGRA